jgi:hypothetical protein
MQQQQQQQQQQQPALASPMMSPASIVGTAMHTFVAPSGRPSQPQQLPQLVSPEPLLAVAAPVPVPEAPAWPVDAAAAVAAALLDLTRGPADPAAVAKALQAVHDGVAALLDRADDDHRARVQAMHDLAAASEEAARLSAALTAQRAAVATLHDATHQASAVRHVAHAR